MSDKVQGNVHVFGLFLMIPVSVFLLCLLCGPCQQMGPPVPITSSQETP